MRLTQYLTEAKNPTTKKFRFRQDNPGGEWLEYEIEAAKRSKFGAAVTGNFRDMFMLPIKMITKLKGEMGEIRTLDEPRVQDLMKLIKKSGIQNPVFINVEWNGTAKINEGNRRVLIAKTLGMKYIPVEVRYYAGGEMIEGDWFPDNLVKIAKAWHK